MIWRLLAKVRSNDGARILGLLSAFILCMGGVFYFPFLVGNHLGVAIMGLSVVGAATCCYLMYIASGGE